MLQLCGTVHVWNNGPPQMSWGLYFLVSLRSAAQSAFCRRANHPATSAGRPECSRLDLSRVRSARSSATLRAAQRRMPDKSCQLHDAIPRHGETGRVSWLHSVVPGMKHLYHAGRGTHDWPDSGPLVGRRGWSGKSIQDHTAAARGRQVLLTARP